MSTTGLAALLLAAVASDGAPLPDPARLPERALVLGARATIGRLEGVGGSIVSTTPALVLGLRLGRLELALEGGGFWGLSDPPGAALGPAGPVVRLDGPRAGLLLGYRAALPEGWYAPIRLRGGVQSATTDTPGKAGYVALSVGAGASVAVGGASRVELELVVLETQMLVGAEQGDGGAFSSVLFQTGLRVSYALGL